jgi:hypothetical protein
MPPAAVVVDELTPGSDCEAIVLPRPDTVEPAAPTMVLALFTTAPTAFAAVAEPLPLPVPLPEPLPPLPLSLEDEPLPPLPVLELPSPVLEPLLPLPLSAVVVPEPLPLSPVVVLPLVPLVPLEPLPSLPELPLVPPLVCSEPLPLLPVPLLSDPDPPQAVSESRVAIVAAIAVSFAACAIRLLCVLSVFMVWPSVSYGVCCLCLCARFVRPAPPTLQQLCQFEIAREKQQHLRVEGFV